MKMRHVPNLLSLIRLALVPVFIWFMAANKTVIAVIAFIVSGFTDVLDGFIARKFNCTSDMGKILDPLADKLMQFSAFICLAVSKLIPVWMPIMYFIKEAATAIGALIVFRKGKRIVKSHIFGKLATVFVFAFVTVMILFGGSISSGVTAVICVAMCLYFVFSCLMYVKTEVKGRHGVEESGTGR